MNNIGYMIKAERLKLNMKQINLARGICSTSYLSKIENNTAIASEEVIQLLLQRLNLNAYNLYNHEKQEELFFQELIEIYKSVTIKRNKKYSSGKLTYLLGEKWKISEKNALYLYLVILRLCLMQNKHKNTEIYLELLEKATDKFTKHQKYLYHKLLGIYYYQMKQFVKSISNFELSYDLSNEISIYDWERADLYYMLGLAYMVNGNTVNSMELTQKSIDYFKGIFEYQRVIDGYIILGVAYKRIQRFKKAGEIFQLVLKIIKEIRLDFENSNKYKGKIYHNLGLIYSPNNSKESIDFFLKSLKYKNKPEEQIITIFSLVKEYAKLSKWDSVKTWVDEGLKLIRKDNTYYFHLLIYKDLSEIGVIREEVGSLSINFFKKSGDYKNSYKYCIMLGESLYQKRKYKLAANYFKTAHLYLLKLNNINRLEDF